MLLMKVGEQNPTFAFQDFYLALKSVDAESGGLFSSQIENVFSARNVCDTCVPCDVVQWQDDEGIASVAEIGNDQIDISWFSIPNAVSYDVLVSTVDYGEAGTGGGGAFVAVAREVTGTSYVFAGRDSLVEYLFSVVGVDSVGQRGYKANPVLVQTAVPTGVSDDPHRTSAHAGRFLYGSPNPFNPETRIVFEVSGAQDVALSIFDVAGRKIRNLGTKRFLAGQHDVRWDGKDDRGVSVSSGQYFVLLRGRGWKGSGKVLLVK
jgi:hypothetical protein